MPNLRTITLEFPVKEQFFSGFEWRNRQPILFIPNEKNGELGDPVKLLIRFPTEDCSYVLNGKIVSRRTAQSGIPPLPSGIETEINREDIQNLQMLLDHAGAKKVQVKERKSRRIPCAFVVQFRKDSAFLKEFASNFSEDGIFIRTNKVIPEGNEIECLMKIPGYKLMLKTVGRVAWVKEQGEPRGMGIEFIFNSELERNKVRTFVDRMQKQCIQDAENSKLPSPGAPRIVNQAQKEAAEQSIQKASRALSSMQYDEAIQFYQEAVQLVPDDPRVHCLLGIACYQKALRETLLAKKLPQPVRKHFLRAIALDNWYDEPRMYLGYIAKRNREYETAIREFQGALECNPENQGAQTEIRILKSISHNDQASVEPIDVVRAVPYRTVEQSKERRKIKGKNKKKK